MKRVIFSVTGTVLGLVALLSFKSHGHAVVGGKLPSAALSTSAAPSASATPGSTSAPPDPSSAGKSSSGAPAPTGSIAPTAKTYDGAAVDTRYGTVQVQVTVSAGKITNVAFLQLTSFDGRSADINSHAAPLLLQETLSAQSSHIDSISGATFTSDGYLQSLQSALDQAGIK